jgi:hypothetical protein
MLAHTIFRPVKRAAPRLSAQLRRVGSAILGPLHFAALTGHARSAWASRAVDSRGSPIPWYTYPAIDFLESICFADRTVLEFGAGQSTVWWSSRAASVVSIEGDSAWREDLRARMSTRVELHDDRDIPGSIAGRRFDVVVVDGLDRLHCARLAIGAVTDDGAIVVDNSECDWGTAGTYPIIALLRDAGFSRVDFHGWSPGVIARSCTSVFFRPGSFLFRGEAPPARLDRYSY